MNKLPTWPSYSKEESLAVSSVVLSNKVNYWTGEECRRFEKEFSSWVGSKYSIALSNGTVALELALYSLGINKSDEVIVTPRSFVASASSVISVGAKPVFADIDLHSGNLTAENIEKKITKKTKAIICVHLGGLPCEMDEIIKLARKHNLFIIEDCAQAHGATYKGRSVGTIGDIGAWSFCQDKIMTTGGEGGMVTTSDKTLWKKMWSYKDHGKDYNAVINPPKNKGFKWIHDTFGSNLRMTEMQAAIGRLQLNKIKKWNKLRNRNAIQITKALSKFPNIINVPSYPSYVNHGFYRVYASIKTDSLKRGWTRDRIIDEIDSLGVPCFSGSCPEIYREQSFISSKLAPNKRLNNAKLLGEMSIAFLCHPNLRLKDLKLMTDNIEKILTKASC